MKKTGGKWNTKDRNLYFLAADPEMAKIAKLVHKHILIPINAINNKDDETNVTGMAAAHNILIDSGVFELANSHAVEHNIPMNVALSLAPDDIDGFAGLYNRYTTTMKRIGSKVWGYIEMDQGGRENKIKTRARLEALGLRPIPVYHPFNDGWDYFDELAQNYDRICFGNVVQADPETRKRLLATAWERKRKYPDLWIHLLGLTPNPMLLAYPLDSCDSSQWLANVRWSGRIGTSTATKRFSTTADLVTYDLGADVDAENGADKARRLGAYDSHFLNLNWKDCLNEYERHR